MTDRERMIEEAIESELAAHGELRPPWIAFPEIPDGSIGWRMGPGEWYLMVFHSWCMRLPADERLAYFDRHRPPLDWAWQVAALLFPEETEHYGDFDPPVERLIELGWIDEAAWRAWLATPVDP